MRSVEVAVRAYARKFSAEGIEEVDEEAWGAIALFHDLDYERHPTSSEHPYKVVAWLETEGWPPWALRAILSHADHTGISRETLLEKTLYACDEVTGLIAAVALVRPSKDIREVKLKSIRKKWKQLSFAAGVDRNLVTKGALALGVDLWEHMAFVLDAMQGESEILGLAGAPLPSTSQPPNP